MNKHANHTAEAPASVHLQVVDQQAPERLLNLMRARDRLRKQVLAKQKTFAETAAKIRDIALFIAKRTMPIAKRLEDIDREIHTIFQTLLTKARLSKSERLNVESIYEGLQEDRTISEDPSQVVREDDFAHGADDDQTAAEGTSPGGHPGRADDLGSAKRPGSENGGPTLRSLFRKLAMAIHPDKAHGRADHARRAEAMKEVTQAYQNRDLARLLELQARWLEDGDLPTIDDQANVDRRCEQVTLEIHQLTLQLKDVALNLRELRSSPPAKMTKSLWRASPQKMEAEIAILEADGERDVRKLTIVRDFAKSFLDGTIALKDFMQGPSELRPKRIEMDPMEEMLFDLFVNEVEEMERERYTRGVRTRRRRQ